MKAFCYADGTIGFGTYVPEGALFVGRGGENQLRAAVVACARLGYEPGVYLVPGVPENQARPEQAVDAVLKFMNRLAQHMGHRA